MGLAPSEVREMSLWQFFAVMDGWNRANDPEAAKKLTENEADALWDAVQDLGL